MCLYNASQKTQTNNYFFQSLSLHSFCLSTCFSEAPCLHPSQSHLEAWTDFPISSASSYTLATPCHSNCPYLLEIPTSSCLKTVALTFHSKKNVHLSGLSIAGSISGVRSQKGFSWIRLPSVPFRAFFVTSCYCYYFSLSKNNLLAVVCVLLTVCSIRFCQDNATGWTLLYLRWLTPCLMHSKQMLNKSWR